MRFGLRSVVSAIAVAATLVSGMGVHLAWQRIAERNGRTLATEVSRQIAGRVADDLHRRLGEAEAAFAAIRTLLVERALDIGEADRREIVFLAQIQAQPTLSRVASGWPDGGYFEARRPGDAEIEMVEIDPGEGARRRRTDRYRLFWLCPFWWCRRPRAEPLA
jgi:adenylate cyclase